MTTEQSKLLLKIARHAVEQAVGMEGTALGEESFENMEFGGVFVTLRRSGRLRGCMGTFAPQGTLVQEVARVATLSCREDPRFTDNPIHVEELAELTIEISVLSEPKRTDQPASLELGRHGVWIRRGSASGCLLPQVAVERCWSAVEFLDQCCTLKAGLPAKAWREPDTETYVFETTILRDTDRQS